MKNFRGMGWPIEPPSWPGKGSVALVSSACAGGIGHLRRVTLEAPAILGVCKAQSSDVPSPSA